MALPRHYYLEIQIKDLRNKPWKLPKVPLTISKIWQQWWCSRISFYKSIELLGPVLNSWWCRWNWYRCGWLPSRRKWWRWKYGLRHEKHRLRSKSPWWLRWRYDQRRNWRYWIRWWECLDLCLSANWKRKLIKVESFGARAFTWWYQ